MTTTSCPYNIPDKEFYAPLFSPWLGYGEFAKYYEIAQPYTLVSPDRIHVLLSLAQQSLNREGAWLEAGVYKGGTAMLLARLLQENGFPAVLHLFDTFEGMPETDKNIDIHRKGDFRDTDLSSVKARVDAITGKEDAVRFYPGFLPATFEGCGIDTVSFAHVDVDIYQSVLDCCIYLYPKMVRGGVLLFDDYGFPSCPGARKAVDEFFDDKPEVPLVLPTGQAMVVKL